MRPAADPAPQVETMWPDGADSLRRQVLDTYIDAQISVDEEQVQENGHELSLLFVFTSFS